MGVKVNFRIITKNNAAGPEKGFLTKSISKPYGCATAMPPAWESRKGMLLALIRIFERSLSRKFYGLSTKIEI